MPTFFPVTGTLQALVSDSSADTDGDPDAQFISATLTFTPSTSQVFAEGKLLRLAPIKARTNNVDGVLKTIDGHTVSLVADTFGIGLTYTVTFTNVVYDKGSRDIPSFSFAAPTDTSAVDLASVEKL